MHRLDIISAVHWLDIISAVHWLDIISALHWLTLSVQCTDWHHQSSALTGHYQSSAPTGHYQCSATTGPGHYQSSALTDIISAVHRLTSSVHWSNDNTSSTVTHFTTSISCVSIAVSTSDKHCVKPPNSKKQLLSSKPCHLHAHTHKTHCTSMASMLDSINSPFLASTLSSFLLATAVMIVTLFLATLAASLASVAAPLVAAALVYSMIHYQLSQLTTNSNQLLGVCVRPTTDFNTNCPSPWAIKRCKKNIAEKSKSLPT